MAKKTVKKKVEKKEPDQLSLYECAEIEAQIEDIAARNDGELNEEELQQLVAAQMTAIEKVENMCKWIRKGEGFIEMCKSEIDRVNKLVKRMDSRINSTKKYMADYVKEKGKMTAGTFELSVRKSESVVVDEMFDDPYFTEVKTTKTPNKKLIKEALKNGDIIEGCGIQEKYNLQIK